MAQILHHQDTAFHGKEFHGCRWSILQFFGFRRRLWSTKMLSDKKHGQGKGSGGNRRRGSYVPLKDEDSGVMDNVKNTEVTKKHKTSKNNSGKASLRSLILRKLNGKEGQKEKMLPVAPKLLRTLSIHYLESNEHVLDGESSSNGDGSSHSTALSMQNATSTNLHHATFNTPDGCDTDTSSLLLLKRADNHVKRKSHRSISMDGVLHKVPYGQKVSGDVIREELSRSASATYDRDGLKSHIGTAAKRPANQGFRRSRSRSLTESLERYSDLLDSISSNESKRMLTSLKSTRDHSLDGPNVTTALQKTSNAEVRSKGSVRHTENLVIPEDALASHVPEKTVVYGYVKVAMDERSSDEVAGGPEIPVLLEEYMSDKKCNVAVSTEAESCTTPPPSEVVDISEEYAATCDDDQVPSSTTTVDCCAFPLISEEVDFPEEQTTTSDDDQIHSSAEDDSCPALPPSEDANIAEEHATTFDDNQIQSSDVLKSIEDSSLKARILILNDAGDSADIDVLNANTTAELSTTSLIHRNVQESDSDYLNGLQVDEKNEAEFNYVKNIFKKSNFSNEMLFDEWYLQNITALQEEDCQHYEAAAAAFDFTDMSADQLLMLDLTNEALLDIYKKYSVCKSKLSWFSSFDRPKLVGNHALKELWSKVSCHLDEQPQCSIEIDTIFSNDLAKSGRWMNFQRDADHLGNKVVDFVFDKLLTELTLQRVIENLKQGVHTDKMKPHPGGSYRKLGVFGNGAETTFLLLKILSVHALQRPWDPGGQDIAIASVHGIKTKENAGPAPPNSTGVQVIAADGPFKTFQAAYQYVVQKVLSNNSLGTRRILYQVIFNKKERVPVAYVLSGMLFSLYSNSVLDEHVTNDEVYRETVEPIIPIIFQRTKATCFAYGQTGSGKTYTRQPLPLRAAQDMVRLLHQPVYRGQNFKLWLTTLRYMAGSYLIFSAKGGNST